MGRLTNIVLNQLRSRVTRRSLTTNGIRLITNNSTDITNTQGDNAGNAIWEFITGVGGFIGWAISKINSLGNFSVSTIWSGITGGIQKIYNFNWNYTDSQIDTQLKQYQTQIAGQLGETLGNAAGYFICGYLPTTVIGVFNPALGAYLLREVGEEAFEEFAANIYILGQTTFKAAAFWLASTIFKNTRNIFNAVASTASSFISGTAKLIFGNTIDATKIKEFKEGNEPWSIRSQIDSVVDAIKIDWLQEFVENFLEELGDACVEAGYVVAGGIDKFIAEKALERQLDEGDHYTVEIQPNRENPNDSIILEGTESQLIEQVPLVMSQVQIMDSRDVGQIIGEPATEYNSRRRSEFELLIRFHSSKSPPFRPYKPNQTAQITIPWIVRSKIDWSKLKVLFGGVNGYTYGRYSCQITAVSAKGSEFKLIFHANSYDEAEELCKAALSLTDGKQIGIPHFGLKKPQAGTTLDDVSIVKMYPRDFTILNKEKAQDVTTGRNTKSGRFKYKKYRVNLWTSEKPADTDLIISQLFSTTLTI